MGHGQHVEVVLAEWKVGMDVRLLATVGVAMMKPHASLSSYSCYGGEDKGLRLSATLL
jgi:hypothetical protein